MKIIPTFLVPLLWFNLTQPASAMQMHSIALIQQNVNHYIASQLPKDSEYDIQLDQIDNRLQLPLCTQPLDIFIHNGSIKPGRNVLGIRCNMQKKWFIYSTATIKMYQNVLVTSHPIQRGELLTKHSFKQEKKDISRLRAGYIIKPELIIGKQATRNLGTGTIINKANTTEPRLIKKGDKVSINASLPNLTINMTGIAMMDGIKGQRIRVKNINSKQTIQAKVINSGQVTVSY